MEYKFNVSGATRTEHDLLGYKEVPQEALFGIQTLRCIENFNISNYHLCDYPEFIKAFGYVKMAAIMANHKLGLVSDQVKDAIVAACQELIEGKHIEHFPIDMIQGGAGTSMNMNANEVIANRALEIMGYQRGEYVHCHPNDHVNMAQSTNDAYPVAMHLGLYFLNEKLQESLKELIRAFDEKKRKFAKILKMGRTQLQDAVPMTMGQSFGAFAEAMRKEAARIQRSADEFLYSNMGATAIGTGITSEPGYAKLCNEYLKEVTGLDIRMSRDFIEATNDTSCMVSFSASMKSLAIRLSKICNDLRLMGSGPRTGLEELNLPPKQPGSSIMPGKVNPVIPEVVNQVCFKVIGNDMAVTMGSEAAQLELNVMEPVMVQALVESCTWLTRAFSTLRVECIEGITVNKEHCDEMVKGSIGIVTALKPYIGYANCSEVAKEALATGGSVYDIVLAKGLLTKKELDAILNPRNMVRPTVIEGVKKFE